MVCSLIIQWDYNEAARGLLASELCVTANLLKLVCTLNSLCYISNYYETEVFTCSVREIFRLHPSLYITLYRF